MLKYSTAVNHYTLLNVTKLDILDTFETIKASSVSTRSPPSSNFSQVAVAYKDPATGETLDHFPADVNTLADLEVVYKEFEGWQKPTTAAKTFVSGPVPLPGALADRQTVRLAEAGACLYRFHRRVCGCARWLGRNWSCAGRHDCPPRGGRCLGLGLLFDAGGVLEWRSPPCLTDISITQSHDSHTACDTRGIAVVLLGGFLACLWVTAPGLSVLGGRFRSLVPRSPPRSTTQLLTMAASWPLWYGCLCLPWTAVPK